MVDNQTFWNGQSKKKEQLKLPYCQDLFVVFLSWLVSNAVSSVLLEISVKYFESILSKSLLTL